jgi:hypothetical protein
MHIWGVFLGRAFALAYQAAYSLYLACMSNDIIPPTAPRAKKMNIPAASCTNQKQEVIQRSCRENI